MNKKQKNALILLVMASLLGFSTSYVRADTLFVDVEITIKQIYFHHFANDGDYIGKGEIGFKVSAPYGESYFDYYGTLGIGTHTISGVSFTFERYTVLPAPYFIIEIWDKDGSNYETDLVFRARLEIGYSGPATYDYNGLYCNLQYSETFHIWLPQFNYNSYDKIDSYLVVDHTAVEHYRTTGFIPTTTIDVDLTYYYSSTG
ncbi:MAG: hypothetical protein KGD64_00610 [Candidatus Heimdallarchaeota archaeon]|nr:hypothetical protein [Candidatus Heimdallarchaeota archaeon]